MVYHGNVERFLPDGFITQRLVDLGFSRSITATIYLYMAEPEDVTSVALSFLRRLIHFHYHVFVYLTNSVRLIRYDRDHNDFSLTIPRRGERANLCDSFVQTLYPTWLLVPVMIINTRVAGSLSRSVIERLYPPTSDDEDGGDEDEGYYNNGYQSPCDCEDCTVVPRYYLS